MPKPQDFLPLETVKSFIAQGLIYAFDPETKSRAAAVEYGTDGVAKLTFSDGQHETGQWGFTQQGYWTSYNNFREGARHEFLLKQIAPQIMQAYHGDGRRAYVQTALSALPDSITGE